MYIDPIPGIEIIEPETLPQEDDVLAGYELIPEPVGTCCCGLLRKRANPKKMRTRGWLASVLSACIFLPLAVVPCFMSCSYETRVLRPVYVKRKNLH